MMLPQARIDAGELAIERNSMAVPRVPVRCSESPRIRFSLLVAAGSGFERMAVTGIFEPHKERSKSRPCR